MYISTCDISTRHIPTYNSTSSQLSTVSTISQDRQLQQLCAGQTALFEDSDSDTLTAVLHIQSLRAAQALITSQLPVVNTPTTSRQTPSIWQISLPSLISRITGTSSEGSSSNQPFNGSSSSSSTPVAQSDIGLSVLVLLTAEWCGPCSLLSRELPKLSALLSKSKLAHVVLVVDVDRNKELASRLGVTSLPMLVYLGSDQTKPPFFSRGLTTAAVIADILANKCVEFGGCNIQQRPWPML